MDAHAVESDLPTTQTPGIACSHDLANPSARIAAFDQTVSFILSVMLDEGRTRQEIRVARSMFAPTANIVLIPRSRPTLASAVSASEFFAKNNGVLKYEKAWIEDFRSHDQFADCDRQFRIKMRLTLDPESSGGRSVDVVFAVCARAWSQRISSCTVVYDETYESRSLAAAC